MVCEHGQWHIWTALEIHCDVLSNWWCVSMDSDIYELHLKYTVTYSVTDGVWAWTVNTADKSSDDGAGQNAVYLALPDRPKLWPKMTYIFLPSDLDFDGEGTQDVPAACGSAPSNSIWDTTILCSPKQQIWLRIALCGGWCRRMVLRDLRVACQKRRRRCGFWSRV